MRDHLKLGWRIGILKGPIRFYLDMVDARALQYAESGERGGAYEAPPYASMFVPWIVMGPFLYLFQDNKGVCIIIGMICIIASIIVYWKVSEYYYRAKRHYKLQITAEDEIEAEKYRLRHPSSNQAKY